MVLVFFLIGYLRYFVTLAIIIIRIFFLYLLSLTIRALKRPYLLYQSLHKLIRILFHFHNLPPDYHVTHISCLNFQTLFIHILSTERFLTYLILILRIYHYRRNKYLILFKITSIYRITYQSIDILTM